MNTKRSSQRAEQLIRHGVEFRGVTAAARRLGCSQPHLSLVLHGQRKPGKALAAKLVKMGVELPEINAAVEARRNAVASDGLLADESNGETA